MKEYFLAPLRFLNLTDYQDRLSITNIAVIVLLVKIGYTPTFDWTVVAGLLVSLLNYSHKRAENAKFCHKQLDTTELQEIKDSIEEVRKSAEEAKDKASKIALATGFRPKS